MKINTHDFRRMRSGSPQTLLEDAHRNLMTGINQHGSGKQSALLMLHGFSSTPAVFKQLLPELKGYDAIVAPALPGHAENMASFGNTKAQAWISAADMHCQALLDVYAKVDVLGLSLGGLLACHLAQHYPLNHLYLLAPALDLRVPLQAGLVLLKLLNLLGFYALYNTGANIISPEHQDIAYRMIPIRSLIEIFRLIKDFQWNPAKRPVDLFLGKYDEVVDVESLAERFARDPQTTIHWLNHSAHLLPLDGDFARIAACINQNTTVS